MRSSLLVIGLILATGCSQEPKYIASGKAKPSTGIDKAVLGEWVTVATSAGHYDGVMTLDANGTFKEKDVFRKDGVVATDEGTFTLKQGATGEVVVMTVEKNDGKPVSGGPPLELNFDRKEQVLSNPFPGVVYARRADAARVTKQFER